MKRPLSGSKTELKAARHPKAESHVRVFQRIQACKVIGR
jgi:hypothetical protein